MMAPTISASVVGLLCLAVPGVFSVAVPAAGGLLERQNGVYCERPGLKVTTVTAATNETSTLKKRSNYHRFCNTGPQTCQLTWRDGSFVCQGYCDCLRTSPCLASGNYCFYNSANGGCYCS